ncbi:MAG: diguanylate cyclase [Spirochaetia bacterium]|nr:diguanylate cyclase [Spirochaetia bacterium]
MKNIKLMNRIGSKVVLVYLSLMAASTLSAVLMIFENQTDLISENTKMKLEIKVENLVNSLEQFSRSMLEDSMFKAQNKADLIQEIIEIISATEKNYILVNELNNIEISSSKELSLPEDFESHKIKAMANYQFSGESYYLEIDSKNMRTYFLIPMGIPLLEKYALVLVYELEDMQSTASVLYRQSFIIVFIFLLINLIFGLIHYRMIVIPVKEVYKISRQIAKGNFDARANIKGNDELAELSRSLNFMGRTLKERFENILNERDVVLKQKEKIEEMASQDELTGLYNRRYLFSKIESEIAKAVNENKSIGFLMLDIDYFKNFNDTYGHQIGDEVLKHVAEQIKKQSRDKDTVARYGGEEFSVLLPDTDEKGLKIAAERIRSRVENTQVASKKGLMNVTISIGGTIVDNELINTALSANKSISKVMNLMIYFADTALYAAKDKGRNRFEMG